MRIKSIHWTGLAWIGLDWPRLAWIGHHYPFGLAGTLEKKSSVFLLCRVPTTSSIGAFSREITIFYVPSKYVIKDSKAWYSVVDALNFSCSQAFDIISLVIACVHTLAEGKRPYTFVQWSDIWIYSQWRSMTLCFSSLGIFLYFCCTIFLLFVLACAWMNVCVCVSPHFPFQSRIPFVAVFRSTTTYLYAKQKRNHRHYPLHASSASVSANSNRKIRTRTNARHWLQDAVDKVAGIRIAWSVNAHGTLHRRPGKKIRNIWLLERLTPEYTQHKNWIRYLLCWFLVTLINSHRRPTIYASPRSEMWHTGCPKSYFDINQAWRGAWKKTPAGPFEPVEVIEIDPRSFCESCLTCSETW